MKDDSTRPGSPETVGAFLQVERLQRGIALTEVAEATGISTAVLAALEEDDRERLPAEVYTRAFCRKYATFLALDPDELLSRYQPRPKKPKKEGAGLNFSTGITLKGHEENRFTSLLQRLLPLLVFLAAAGLLYWLYKKYLAPYNPFGFERKAFLSP